MAEPTTGHCMKCKDKKEMVDAEVYVMKNGRKAMKGQCKECGTKMFAIMKKDDADMDDMKKAA